MCHLLCFTAYKSIIHKRGGGLNLFCETGNIRQNAVAEQGLSLPATDGLRTDKINLCRKYTAVVIELNRSIVGIFRNNCSVIPAEEDC